MWLFVKIWLEIKKLKDIHLFDRFILSYFDTFRLLNNKKKIVKSNDSQDNIKNIYFLYLTLSVKNG
jgi:hypothetical protein